MKIYELKTINGRVFRVVITDSKSQRDRLDKIVRDNKSKDYEVFTSVKCVSNGIHNLKDFETIADSLV